MDAQPCALQRAQLCPIHQTLLAGTGSGCDETQQQTDLTLPDSELGSRFPEGVELSLGRSPPERVLCSGVKRGRNVAHDALSKGPLLTC